MRVNSNYSFKCVLHHEVNMGFDVLKFMVKAPLAAQPSLSPFVLFDAELNATSARMGSDVSVAANPVSKPLSTGRIPSAFHSLFATRSAVPSVLASADFTTYKDHPSLDLIPAARPGTSFENGAVRFVSAATAAPRQSTKESTKPPDVESRRTSNLPSGIARSLMPPVEAPEPIFVTDAPILSSASITVSESPSSDAKLPDHTTEPHPNTREIFPIQEDVHADVASNRTELPLDWHVLNLLNTPVEDVFLNSVQLTELISLAQASGSDATLQNLAVRVFYPAAALQDLASRLEFSVARASFAPATIDAIQNKLIVLRANLALLKASAAVPARDATALFNFAAISFVDEAETSAFQAVLNEVGSRLNAMIREPARMRSEIRQSFVDLRATLPLRESFENGDGDVQDGVLRIAASSQTSGDSEGEGERGQEQQD